MTIAIDIAGAHPSTELCLEALQWLHERYAFANILDMGCGNGILSLAAASIWQTPVLAVDISPKAIEDTKHHINEHGLEEHITALRSDGFTDPLIQKRAPYDLVLFNLLAEQHVQMGAALRSHMQQDSICIASGILAWKAETMETVYEQLGFNIIRKTTNTPWQTYIMQLAG